MENGLTMCTGPKRITKDTMEQIGLDVSLKNTSISIRQEGKRIWRGKCPSYPKLLAEVIRNRAPQVKRVVFETGLYQCGSTMR